MDNPFECNLQDIRLVHQAREALRRARATGDRCQHAISDLKLLEAVLRRTQRLSPEVASEETLKTVQLCGIACREHLSLFLQSIKELAPMFNREILVADVNSWYHALIRETSTLRSRIGTHLQLVDALFQIEALQSIAAGKAPSDHPHQSHAASPSRFDVHSVARHSETSRCGKIYTDTQIGGNARVHMGDNIYYVAVDEVVSAMGEFGATPQGSKLLALVEQARVKGDLRLDALSTMGLRSSEDIKAMKQTAELIYTMLAASLSKVPSGSRSSSRETSSGRGSSSSLAASSTNISTHMNRDAPGHHFWNIQAFLDALRQAVNSIILLPLWTSPAIRALFRSVSVVVRSPTLLLDTNITLVTATTREMSLPSGHFRFWPVMLERLKCEFRGSPAQQRVDRCSFALCTFDQMAGMKKINFIQEGDWERSYSPVNEFRCTSTLSPTHPKCSLALRAAGPRLIPPRMWNGRHGKQ